MKLAAIALAVLFPLFSAGQNLRDTVIRIEKIGIAAARVQSDNVAGSRRTVVSPEIIADNATRAVSQLLGENTLVHIKSMGQGGLATSSFRGTASNHTQVNWNGVGINSPMLGSFDFSQMPVFFTDEVTIFHGGGYLRSGTGALGGSINFNNTAAGSAKGRQQAIAEYGSNTTFTGGTRLGFSTGKLISVTRLYCQSSKNDFEYINKSFSKNPFSERRKNAGYLSAGAMQEFYYTINPRAELKTILWLMHSDRDIPASIAMNSNPGEAELDNNLRTMTALTIRRTRAEFTTSAYYIRDFMRYSRPYSDGNGDKHKKNLTESFVAKEDMSFKAAPSLKITSTAMYRLDKAAYPTPTLTKNVERNTVSLQAGSEWKPLRRATVGLSAMGESVGDGFMPTFSAGARYALIEDRLDVGGSTSYNYHRPTLNDLYWQPGGNPDLKPEKGVSWDATIGYRKNDGGLRFRIDATYYQSTVTDWIAWRPTGTWYWAPQNVKNVLARGVEIFTEISSGKHSLGINYGYSSSVSRVRDGTYNKQLPYIPLNKWNARYAASSGRISWRCNAMFTDRRYTNTDEKYSTDAYTVFDAELGYRMSRHITIKARAENVLDTYYESTKDYPLPGRLLFIGASALF